MTSKSKVDLARLPPCQSALKPHIQRVNHCVALYKRANEPFIEKPKPYSQNQGWTLNDGLLEPVWSNCAVLPSSLVDILGHEDLEQDSVEHSEDEEEDENDMEDLIDDDADGW